MTARRPHTLRGRLTLMFGALTIVLCSLVGVLVDLQYRGELRAALDKGLSTRLDALRQELVLAGKRPLKPPIPDAEAFAQVINERGHIIAAAPRALVTRRVLTGADLRKVSRDEVTLVRSVPPAGERARLRVASAKLQGGDVAIVVGTSLEETARAQQRLELSLIVGLPLLAAVVTLAGWFLAGAALAPVRGLIEEADAISAIAARGDKRRLSIPETGEELAELARRLNALLARIEAALEHERSFLDDASHELRTPIAIARAELELARMRVADGSETAESLDSSLEEIERLDHLAANLLVLARVRSAGPPTSTLVDLRAVAERVVDDVGRSKPEFAGRVVIDGSATAVGDGAALERVLTNLVDNAVRHARATVVVHLADEGTSAVVEVRDDGPGFDDQLLGGAFGRFVQGPAGGGAAGLGLAIVDAIVAAHGGTIAAENSEPSGALVRVLLPSGDSRANAAAASEREPRLR